MHTHTHMHTWVWCWHPRSNGSAPAAAAAPKKPSTWTGADSLVNLGDITKEAKGSVAAKKSAEPVFAPNAKVGPSKSTTTVAPWVKSTGGIGFFALLCNLMQRNN
jgi:hypothetical protein